MLGLLIVTMGGGHSNKIKAFTLIELLAIIVILAIIAVITVPIILNVIDNAKKGSVIDSAYGYKDAVQKFYVSKLYEDTNFKFNNGTYTVGTLKTMGVNVDGTSPTDDSWVTITNNQVIDYSLKFDEWVVNYNNGNPEASKDDLRENPGLNILNNIVSYIDNATASVSVYYDPVNNIMNCTNYHVDNSKAGFNGIVNRANNGTTSDKTANQTSCLKWYKYSINDDNTVNMLLDHNTSVGIQWYTSDNNKVRPTTLLSQLQADTSEWSSTLSRSDKYIPELYKGTSNKWDIDYSGYNARVITAQEVAGIVGHTTFNEKTTTYSNYFYFGSLSTTNYSNQNDEQKARQRSYAWLFDNLNSCTSYGCSVADTINSSNYGYWTSSPVTGSSNGAWSVINGGRLFSTGTRDVSRGVRPVITISES